jgi:hypothetical protein
VAVLTPDGRRVSLYPFKEITAVRPLRDDASAVTVVLHGRARLFALPERAALLRALATALAKVGLAGVVAEAGVTAAEHRAEIERMARERLGPLTMRHELIWT